MANSSLKSHCSVPTPVLGSQNPTTAPDIRSQRKAKHSHTALNCPGMKEAFCHTSVPYYILLLYKTFPLGFLKIPPSPFENFSFFFSFSFFFLLFRAVTTAYGGSQARGQNGATADSLCHSHRNIRSEPHLQPTPQFIAMPDP